MAMLKYGQYMSQYDVRDISSRTSTLGNPEKPQQTAYYLVGSNDVSASDDLKLASVPYDHSVRDAKSYLAWVKQMVRKGHTVTIAVYMNYYLFYGITIPEAGEWDYDHIVSVSSIESDYDDDEYHADDIITMEDHGLWAPRLTGPQYLFSYTFKEFPATREEANSQVGKKIYSLPSSLAAGQFGIAHTGVKDDEGSLLRMKVTTNVNYESPEIDNRSEKRPPSMPIILTITVSGVTEGENYVLYKYDDETAVPTKSFNANKDKAISAIPFVGTISGCFVTSETIQSNQKVIFRAVRSDAV